MAFIAFIGRKGDAEKPSKLHRLHGIYRHHVLDSLLGLEELLRRRLLDVVVPRACARLGAALVSRWERPNANVLPMGQLPHADPLALG